MVRLIDDLDYATVLSKTGSKTLFVADDDAFDEFYKNNSWGVKCYDSLTIAQKKLLLHTSMLDNPYLLEMLPHISSNSQNTDGSYLEKNQCMRRLTSLTITDSISFFMYNSDAIPKTSNKEDVDYWARFHEMSKGGLYMANDGTVPMMIHWINSQMEEQGITDEDFAVIAGRQRDKNDVFIYDSKIVEQDITCQNGYINKMDRVLLAPTNMAEMIRTNGKTKHFSRQLERFSAPFYSASLTNSLRQLPGYEGVDSVFEKRYFSVRSQGGNVLDTPPNGSRKVPFYLNFDPAWNTYANASHDAQQDIGAMFVPSDEAMVKYFLPGGGGEFLINAFKPEENPNTEEFLDENLDQIPLEVIQALINNLMKVSFIESVPSKYISIMNDARDPMFSDVSNVEAFREMIDTCLIANNGVVYIMNEVRTPAQYASVSAPALVDKVNLNIMNWIITADDKYMNDPNNAPLNEFYSRYLLAMNSDFSLFLPTDKALENYFDPVSMSLGQPHVVRFAFNQQAGNNFPVSATLFTYDIETGEAREQLPNRWQGSKTSPVTNRLKDLLEAHIIVHDSTSAEDGILSGHTYYTTKGGAPIKVTDPEKGINGGKVQGAWQIEKDDFCNIIEIFDQSRKTNGYGNGKTYIIDRPIQSAVQSVFKVLCDNYQEDSPYREFFELCQVNPEVIEKAGFVDDLAPEGKEGGKEKYMIFTASNLCIDYNVRFFNTYRYTVYIPTNEAVKAEIAKGLPTWESIERYINETQADIENTMTGDAREKAIQARNTKAQAMCTALLNFVKYHFQDDAVYNDVLAMPSKAYETACINAETNRYITVDVQNSGNNNMTVTDKIGQTRHIDAIHQNIMTRDLQFTGSSIANKNIETSSFAVLHQIDGVLNFTELPNGRYEGLYDSSAKAKKFMAKYPIR